MKLNFAFAFARFQFYTVIPPSKCDLLVTPGRQSLPQCRLGAVLVPSWRRTVQMCVFTFCYTSLVKCTKTLKTCADPGVIAIRLGHKEINDLSGPSCDPSSQTWTTFIFCSTSPVKLQLLTGRQVRASWRPVSNSWKVLFSYWKTHTFCGRHKLFCCEWNSTLH